MCVCVYSVVSSKKCGFRGSVWLRIVAEVGDELYSTVDIAGSN